MLIAYPHMAIYRGWFTCSGLVYQVKSMHYRLVHSVKWLFVVCKVGKVGKVGKARLHLVSSFPTCKWKWGKWGNLLGACMLRTIYQV